MNYKKIECDNYNIHLIDDKRFHTYLFRIFFTENVSKELITYRNFLSSILTYSSNKYNSKNNLLKKCQDLYAISPSCDIVRYGNLLTTKFGISTLDSMYIDKEMFLETIRLLSEIILNPHLENNEFNKKYFDIVKEEEINDCKTIKEDTRLYSNMRLLESLSNKENNNYNLTLYSDIDIINKITRKSLYQSYLNLINKSRIDIFVCGNIFDEDKIVNTIKESFTVENNHYNLNDYYIYHHEYNNINLVKEKGEYNQSKLSMCFKAYDLTDYESRYVFPIINLFFGGNYSILMREVREKYSLAYYIYTYYNKLDNIMVLNSGINKNNYDDVIKLIKKIFKDIQNGKIAKKEIEKCKKEYINDLKSILENSNGLIEYTYGRAFFKTDDIKTRINNIKKVTKEDVIKMINKIKIDTIFFLEGEL